MVFYPFNWRLEADLEIKVRLSIFIVISVCAGLPALVWSVIDLIRHRKNGHRISVFIILLLLTDFLEILLSPYILIKHLLVEIKYLDRTFWVLWSLREMSRDCGILLNQLVALEGIMSVKYPLYSAASVFPSPCFIIFYMLMFICTFFGHLFLHYVYLLLIALVVIVSVITWISLTCEASCSADRHSSRKPDHHVVVVFIFTLLVIYLPYILLRLFLYLAKFFLDHLPLLCIPSFLISMRLISDPLLCVLVCRQNLRM